MAPPPKSKVELEREKKVLEAKRDYLKSLKLERGTEAFEIRTEELTRIRFQLGNIRRFLDPNRHEKKKQFERESKSKNNNMNSTKVSQRDRGYVMNCSPMDHASQAALSFY